VFANFGSGTLQGVPTFFDKYCTVDPVGILNERHALIGDMNGQDDQFLMIHPDCPVTTPWDKVKTMIGTNYIRNGTCGVGVGATHQREADRISLRYSDLFIKPVFKIKIGLIEKYYGEDISREVRRDLFYEAVNNVTKLVPARTMGVFLDETKPSNVIYEGSQGLLLDQDIGFFPHVTRSNVGMKNIHENSPKQFYVMRAYQTRHGAGPMTNLGIPNNIKINPEETNVTNRYQGEFKRSILDLDLIRYGMSRDPYLMRDLSFSTLVITCLDHVEDEWKFTHDGELFVKKNEDEFVKSICGILGFKKSIRIKSPRTEDVGRRWSIT
jgi:adenylosuccinate synthase